ncbi:MAG: outer membrane protein assembly factor BamD [Planctomycetaceae bacterium]|jgi:outer membrane protein assembly factor BamD (BamD/ComL family)
MRPTLSGVHPAPVRSVPQRVGWWSTCLLSGLLSLAGCKSTLDNLDVKNMLGPTGRRARDAAEEANGGRKMAEMEGFAEYEAAREKYEAGEYKDARKQFHKVVKKFKDKPIEEDAMFLRAESDFRLDKLADAQDGYDELLKKYPSSRYLETATQRLYGIAMTWLGNPKPATEVEMQHFAQSGTEQGLDKNADTQIPAEVWFPVNVSDRKRPVFDPDGRALEALRSVWMNDPTGPLADDALLAHAVYRLRSGDFIEADRDFATIREQYADREVAAQAYVLGAHSALLAYQGPAYDGKQLEEARQLTQSALRLFPNLPQKQKLENDLARIKEEQANRDFIAAQYHIKRNEKSAAAYYLESMVQNQPDSRQVEKARELLVQLGPEHAAGLLPKPIYNTEVVNVASGEEEAPPERVAEEPAEEQAEAPATPAAPSRLPGAARAPGGTTRSKSAPPRQLKP